MIIFTVNGKDNNSSDLVVRRKKVAEVLYWLAGEKENGEPNNPLYTNVKIEKQTLANLPENGILSDVARVECETNADENEDLGIDSGPVNFEDDEKVYKLKWEALFQQTLTPKRKKKLSMKNFLILHNRTIGILVMSH